MIDTGMYEDTLDYTEILWEGTPRFKKVLPFEAVHGVLFGWMMGFFQGILHYYYNEWTDGVYEFVIYWSRLFFLASVILVLVVMVFSLRFFFYQFIITDKGICLKKWRKMTCYSWERIPSVTIRKYFLFSFLGQYLNIPIYHLTPREKALFKKKYPGLKNVQIKFEYLSDYTEPKSIIEQHISGNLNSPVVKEERS
jgi:hypothetical protein